MIEFFNVDLNYDNRQVLSDITFKIDRGEFVYLTGPSGAGKSSILRLIYFECLPDAGAVVVNQYSSAKIRFNDIPYLRRTLGVIFQDFKLLPRKTVFQNVAIALEVTGERPSVVRKKTRQALKAVGLSKKEELYPLQLSGGEQQRVAIARAVVNDPLILIADEPTGNLDPDITRDIMILFRSINLRGTTVIIATHSQELMKDTEQRIILLKEGKMLRER